MLKKWWEWTYFLVSDIRGTIFKFSLLNNMLAIDYFYSCSFADWGSSLLFVVLWESLSGLIRFYKNVGFC